MAEAVMSPMTDQFYQPKMMLVLSTPRMALLLWTRWGAASRGTYWGSGALQSWWNFDWKMLQGVDLKGPATNSSWPFWSLRPGRTNFWWEGVPRVKYSSVLSAVFSSWMVLWKDESGKFEFFTFWSWTPQLNFFLAHFSIKFRSESGPVVL